MVCRLTDVTEPFSLICVVGGVRASAYCWRSSLSLVTTSVLPPDQAHVDEREDHSSGRECNFDNRALGVPRTVGGREEISRADTRWLLALISRDRRSHLRNGLCKSDSKRHGNGTSRLATSVVGRPCHDQWSAD
jgi:hypothetical protein